MLNGEESQPRDGKPTAFTAEFRLPARNPSPLSGTPLINNLPPELLVQIIEEIRLAQKRSATYWVASPWTITYQLVCRRWRDVILSTPSLWQEIIVYERAECLEFCLKQCAGALATVHVWHPAFKPDHIFAILGRYASSIREYHVHCDVPELRDLSGLPLLLATPMPALEALSLDGPYYEDSSLDVPLTRNLVPHLTMLDLRNCTAPRDIAVYTSLRKLVLCGSTWAFSYDEFIDVIGKCHALESLDLDEEILDPFAEELADGWQDLHSLKTPLVLPRLERMTLAGQRPVLSRFLGTIHAPRPATIELTKCIDDDEPIPLFTRLLPPDSLSRFPFLSSPRAISLTCWDRDAFGFSLRCGPRADAHCNTPAPSLSIDYGMAFNESWPGNANLERNLVAAMDFFSLASLDTLHIEGYLDEVAVETWQRVFQTFSDLRTLQIRGRRTFDSLWIGLQRATQFSLRERDGAVCCPSLSEILVDDPPWRVSHYKFDATAALFDLIPGVLRARAAAGGARLKRFQLYLHYTDDMWSQLSERRDAFVEDVKALVEELDYRDGRT